MERRNDATNFNEDLLYLEGRFNRGFFCITSLGGSYLEGLINGGAYFLNFKVPVAAHECTLASLTADNRFSGQGKWEAMIMGSCRR